MKIAIHHRSGSFSERWINYCEKNAIDFKLVNAFDNNIIEQLADCDALLWHHHQAHFKDVLVAKKVLAALEHANIKVFPDFKTGWHFDDKVAQKYLFEALNVPLVKSYVFYDKKDALAWANSTDYPKVFKLKGGACSANVKLVRTKADAYKLIKKAFGKGFSQFDARANFQERLSRFKSGKDNFLGILKGFYRLLITPAFSKLQPPERGYVYFQDFIPDNNFDIRVVVIGNKKAAAEKRFVRENDFRASGSGKFSYEGIDKDFISAAFHISKKLEASAMAFDFVRAKNGQVLLIEVSYGFGVEGIQNVPGYWDESLNWIEDKFLPEEEIIKYILND